MSILDQIFQRNPQSRDDEIMNAAMELSLEWGANFRKPIQDRLLQRFPDLPRERADELDKFCREVQSLAFGRYYDAVAKGDDNGTGVEHEIKKRYPFLNQANLNRLQTQGLYYAHK